MGASGGRLDVEALALAPLGRRLLSLIYEALLLAAVLWAAALLFTAIEKLTGFIHPRLAFQAYLFVVCGVYFVWQWRHGQTLPMKTWQLRLVTETGAPIGTKQAWVRYALATLGLVVAGLGFAWAFVDRDRQFLHDRLAGTRVISFPAST